MLTDFAANWSSRQAAGGGPGAARVSERLCRDPEIIHGSDVDYMPCGHVQAGTSRRVLSSAVKLPPGLCFSEMKNSTGTVRGRPGINFLVPVPAPSCCSKLIIFMNYRDCLLDRLT